MHRLRHVRWGIWIVLLIQLLGGGMAYADSYTQQDIYQMGIGYYDVSGGSCATGDTTLAGDDPEQEVWNYFTGTVGLSAAATAGIMGNLEQESGFNPSARETPTAWTDMTNNYNDAVGLAQWDGSLRPQMIKAGEAAGLTVQDLETASSKNLSFQLQYLSQQLQSMTDSNGQTIIATLKTYTTSSTQEASTAAQYFLSAFEKGSDPGGIRESNAESIYTKYSGTTGTTTGGGGCAVTASYTTCANGTPITSGVAKIYCEALRFNHTASYSESAMGNHMGSNLTWIQQVCPAAAQPEGTKAGTITPSCYVDCSGLVNISVYLAFGYDLQENTTSEYADSLPSAKPQLWEQVKLSQVQEGDLIQPAAEHGGHVEIIEKAVPIPGGGTEIYTMGAHTSNVAQYDQVDTVNYPASPGDVYLHWIGPTGGGEED